MGQLKHAHWIVGIITLLAPLACYAGTASQRLDDFFNNTQVLQADFHQTLLDGKGKKTKEASGTLVMQRPGKFGWDYQERYKQLIVSDGSKIWIYDRELEQVTVKPIESGLSDTPALLLSGDKPLDQAFVITDLGENGGLEWVELMPKVSDTSFERVRLGFGKDDLQGMELVDNFGQTTRLDFTNLKRNPAVEQSLFTFTPPPGVDVIG